MALADEQFQRWVVEEIERLRQGLTLRTPSRYQSIFKYVDLNNETSWEKLETTLNHFSFEGSTSLALNDPFEASPTEFDDLDARRVATITKFRQGIDQDFGDKRSIEEAFADLQPYRAEAKDFLTKTREHSRIVAFCERPDSGLLWSHYASKYQGACLHFLADAFDVTSQYTTFGYVNYSSHRPIYPSSLALALARDPKRPFARYNWSPSTQAESDKVLFFTKASEWAYETELRLIYRPSERFQFAKFMGRSLLSIITGPRMAEENKQRLANIVRNSPLTHIAIRSAKLSGTSFTVDIDTT